MNDLASAVLVSAVEGTALDKEEKNFFLKEKPAGITLFKRNIPPFYSDLNKLISEIQATREDSSPHLIMAIDQEGGRVARLGAPFPNLGPAQYVVDGKSDEESLCLIENYGFVVGTGLRALGVNVNFAPVVDIITESTHQAVGDRAFGNNPEDVTKRAGAFIKGLQKSGVYGCLKHFPGKGAASVDTHLSSAVIKCSREELEKRELVPFRRLLEHASLVMVSHGIYPAFGDKEASRSPEIITRLLKKEMGFTGIVVSDDMNMGALPQAEKEWQEAIVESVAAGADMILVCKHLERSYKALEALRGASKKSKAFQSRLEDAAKKVMSFRKKL